MRDHMRHAPDCYCTVCQPSIIGSLRRFVRSLFPQDSARPGARVWFGTPITQAPPASASRPAPTLREQLENPEART